MARLLPVLLAVVGTWVQAQALPDAEEGAPHATRMGWNEYQGHSQNWAAAQSPRGLVYVANTWGVLEYDGAEWRLMPFGWDARTLVRSMTVGRSGRLYVGGNGELGVLAPDSTHTLAFQSLVHAIPARMRDFSDVWATHATPRGIVFQTPEYLYRWTGRRMQAWRAETRFHLAFLVGDRVYVREEGVGLMVLDGDALRLVPGGEAFAERRIFALMPHAVGLLAVVRDEGLWVLDGSGARAFESAAGAYLSEYRPYGGVVLPPSTPGGEPLYAVASFGGGVVVMDQRGQILRVHREDVGLEPDDWVLGMTLDAQGGLWLTLLDGIVHLDLAPRLTEFGSREGLTGVVYSVERHEGTLYVGTSTGLFQLVRGQSGRPGSGPLYSHFQHISAPEGIDLSQTWSLLSTSHGLIVAANGGLFSYQQEQLTQLSGDKTLRLGAVPDRADVIVGTKDGLRLLRRERSGWALSDPLAEIDGEINSFVTVGNAIWVGLMDGRALRVARSRGQYRVDRFGEADGIQPGPATVVEWGEGFRIIQQAGVLKPVRTAKRLRFERDPQMMSLEGQYSLFSGQRQRQWLYRDGWLATLGRTARPFRMRLSWAEVSTVSEEPTGVIWIGSNDGLYRYDPRVLQPERPFPALVRRVTDARRVTLYGGALRDDVPADAPSLVLPYATNSLRFEFGAAAFSRPEGTDYQFRLDGLEGDTWSPWAPEKSTNYTQLWEGTYTFRVRARDAYGRIGEEDTFTLRILPPWYRTVWAYLAYLALVVGAVWAFTAWRLHKLRVAAEAQRARNARLNRLGERLREANTRLRRAERLKDDLLANTSHELRTPLTAVMGYSEMLLDEIADDQRDLAEGIHRGGQRLLGTVNGLLDMFKLQSGTLDLFPEALDAGVAVRETTDLLRPLADARGLTLRVLPETLALPVVVDNGVLDRIVTNLVGNAIKFTDAGGVDVLLDADDERLYLTVRDTGIGIPPEMTERIFEPFEQVSTGHARSHEGTGLGLAIVQRLVDLVGGTVTVESQPGVGTAFRVTMPRVASAAPRTRVVVGEQNATLGGAHVFGVCVPREATDALSEWLAPTGVVRAVDVPGRAARLLRRTTYDAVLIGADRPETEQRRTRQLRRVPGYAHTPMIRIGGETLAQDDLLARGFTHQLPLPLDVSVVVPLLEQILSRVESNEEAETLAQ